jgi:drug/metabolite transporter (DMT)-like permease
VTRPPRGGTSPALTAWAALATIYVVWGSTYLGIRYMVETIPAMLGAGARFLLAGALLWLWLRWRNGPSAEPMRASWWRTVWLLGLLLPAGGNGLVTVAEDLAVPSGLAALIVASVPLWVVLLRLVAGDRPAPRTLAGVGLGFIGVALLLRPGDHTGEASTWALLLVVLAAVLWATGSFASPRLPQPSDPFRAMALQMMAGGVILTVGGIARGELDDVHLGAISLESWLGFAYLVTFGSILAFSAYAWLLRNVPVSRAATYAYVNPVIAVFLGWSFVNEPLTATTVIGTLVIVASVALVVRQEAVGRPVAEQATGPRRSGERAEEVAA